MRRAAIASAILLAVAFLALIAAVALEGGNPGYTEQFVPSKSDSGTSEVLLVIGAASLALALVAAVAAGVLWLRRSRGRSNPRRF